MNPVKIGAVHRSAEMRQSVDFRHHCLGVEPVHPIFAELVQEERIAPLSPSRIELVERKAIGQHLIADA